LLIIVQFTFVQIKLNKLKAKKRKSWNYCSSEI